MVSLCDGVMICASSAVSLYQCMFDMWRCGHSAGGDWHCMPWSSMEQNLTFEAPDHFDHFAGAGTFFPRSCVVKASVISTSVARVVAQAVGQCATMVLSQCKGRGALALSSGIVCKRARQVAQCV